MIKKLYTLLILCSTLFSYGQHITLLKNYNPKAQELKHHLNETRDSLIMECKNSILKVEIFNENYEKTTLVNGSTTKIPLVELPEGKFIVEAQLTDKTIVMDVIKYNFVNNNSTVSNSKEVIEGSGMMLDENLRLIKSPPKHSLESILSRGKRTKETDKRQKYYWVVNKVNNELGARKIMKLANQESVDKMIKRNKLEHKSVLGKFNELTVWEVYDTTQFMKHQISNPEFVYSLSSEVFNVTPYYSKENSIQKP